MTKERTKEFTTGQAAKICGVSNRTLLNWIGKGILQAYKLPGNRGDHRINVKNLITFMQNAGMPLPVELRSMQKTILIIDDELNICRAIARALRPLKVECHFAHSAFDAGYLYSQVSPDLVTLDIQLPDANGLTLLKQLQHSNQFHSQLIVISGSEYSWLNRARASGADAVLSKPFDNDTLLKTADALINTT